MKLMILQLSDLHFNTSGNFKNENIKAIVGALQQSSTDIQNLLVILSGDISFSGKKKECINADRFMLALKRAIYRRYNIQDIQFAIVPGNHDVDFDLGLTEHIDLEKIEHDNSYDSIIATELNKQKEFYVLANRYDCFHNGQVIHQKVITYEDKRVLLNLINTALFSAKMDEDQGFHYLPEKDIKLLSSQGNNDYVITVMHHPHHFFSWRCKKELERAIYKCSDLIFVGHEHFESAQKVEDGEASVNIFAGGKLCNKGDWSDSEFHVAILDLDSREYITRKYLLNQSTSVYEEEEKKSIKLSKDRYNELGLAVRSEFTREIDEDKYDIAKSDQEYFVFPLLKEERIADSSNRFAKEIDSMPAFMKVLDEFGKIIINGISGSGKSILARAIFKEISRSKVTVFVKGEDVTGNYERTIRDAFEDAYSNDRKNYEAFKQMSLNQLAIVIDDIDLIDSSRQNSFIEYIEKHFGTIVETCQFDIDIDVNIKDRLRKRANTRDFTIFKIEPFFSDKRRLLVTNIVNIVAKEKELEERKRIIDTLCDALTKQKYLYSLNPDFIVQFVRHFCKNIREAMQHLGTVYLCGMITNITQ